MQFVRRNLLVGGLLAASALGPKTATYGTGRDAGQQTGFGGGLDAGWVHTTRAKMRERVSVSDFGAIGDGVTNDAANIALAVTACAAGQTLYFPPGEYLVSPTVIDAAIVLPVGVNLLMDPGAWLIASTSFGGFIAPKGDNIIQCNIDGRGYPASGGVTGTWTIENVGIRSYFNASLGIGSKNVTIINSQIKNLSYGILTIGPKYWRVYGNNFHRIKQSCAQFGYYSEFECLHNVVSSNAFEDAGDYAVAFYQDGSGAAGVAGYNSVVGNVARNMNQRTNGYAYGVEQGVAANQYNFLFADNIYETDVATGTVSLGGITISTTTNSVVSGNVLRGSLGSNADVGINCLLAVNATIAGNTVSRFRGGGADVDGCTTALVADNQFVNCGDVTPTSAPLLIASFDSTSGITVRDNIFEIKPGYPYYGAGVSCVSAFVAAGKTVSGIVISGNTMINPSDRGITLQGADGNMLTSVLVSDNYIRGIGDATFFAREPIYMDYVAGALVNGNSVNDAKRGYVMTNSTDIAWSNNKNTGAVTVSTAFYNITASTAIRYSDNNNTQPLGRGGLMPLATFTRANGFTASGDQVIPANADGVTG